MKSVLFLTMILASQISLANANDDQGFHDCRLAAREVAESFFKNSAGILNVKVISPSLYFSNKSDSGYLFYGTLASGQYEVAVQISDEASCLPKSVTLNQQ